MGERGQEIIFMEMRTIADSEIIGNLKVGSFSRSSNTLSIMVTLVRSIYK